MNFARTAFLLVVLSLPGFAAEADKMEALHAEQGEAAAATQARPEMEAVQPQKAKMTYAEHVNACLQTRQDFGAPGMNAPVNPVR